MSEEIPGEVEGLLKIQARLELKLEAATQLLASGLLSKYDESDNVRTRTIHSIARNAIEAKYLTLKREKG